jgi:hypothetical protein
MQEAATNGELLLKRLFFIGKASANASLSQALSEIPEQ